MSGTFENLTVPPTLVSFAVTTQEIDKIISPEFKKSGNAVYFIKAEFDDNYLPKSENLREVFYKISKLIEEKKIISAYAVGMGGVAEAIYKMSIGNYLGFEFNENLSLQEIFAQNFASFLVEVEEDIDIGVKIGKIVVTPNISYKNELISLDEMSKGYEEKLESIYSCNINQSNNENMISPEYKVNAWSSAGIKVAKPKVVIPVFPGTNCEYDLERIFNKEGGTAEIGVFNNLSYEKILGSIDDFVKRINNTQILMFPGGFSSGDEPDGSAKFIVAVLKNKKIMEAVHKFLERDGLILGICNGFQALIKSGLLPYGEIRELDDNSPTLTYNSINKHMAKMVRTKIITDNSPWLAGMEVGEIHTLPMSHGEGRVVITEEEYKKLYANNQIATKYVDFEGNPSMETEFNPNGSYYAIEGMLAYNGRIFGKMAHSERMGKNLYKNIYGNKEQNIFRNGIKFFL